MSQLLCSLSFAAVAFRPSSCDLERRLNPYAVDAYDGVNLHPLEVLFVKVKAFMLQAAWTAPVTSQVYDRWSSHKVSLTASTVTLLHKLCIALYFWHLKYAPTVNCLIASTTIYQVACCVYGPDRLSSHAKAAFIMAVQNS